MMGLILGHNECWGLYVKICMADPCFPLFLLKNMHFHAMRGLCKFLVFLDPIFLVIYHFSGSDTMNFLYSPRSIKVCEAFCQGLKVFLFSYRTE